MNDLSIISNTTLTMTSLEIAELVGSRHDNVKRATALGGSVGDAA